MDDRVEYHMTYEYLDKRGYRRMVDKKYYNDEIFLREYKKAVDNMGKEKGPIELPHVVKSVNGELGRVFDVKKEMCNNGE